MSAAEGEAYDVPKYSEPQPGSNPGLEGLNSQQDPVSAPHPELVVHTAQPDLKHVRQNLLIRGFLIAFIVILILIIIFELFQELIDQSRIGGNVSCIRYIGDPPPYEPDDGSISRVAEDASFSFY